MIPALTANDLFDTQRAPLKLAWVAGKVGRSRLLEAAKAEFPGMALVGHMNLVHPNRIQVVADNELRYLQNLSEQERENTMHTLFSNDQVAALIFANNKEIRADFVEHADRLAVPLFSTPLAGPWARKRCRKKRHCESIGVFHKIGPDLLVIGENQGRDLVIREQGMHGIFTLLLAQVLQVPQFVISHDLDPIGMHEVHMSH